MAIPPISILAHYERRFPTQDKLRFDKKDEGLLEEIVHRTDLIAPNQSYLLESETWMTKEQARKEIMYCYVLFYSKACTIGISETATEIMGKSRADLDLPQHIGHVTKVLTALRRLRVMEQLERLGRDLHKGDLNSAGSTYQTLSPIDPAAADLALNLLRDYKRANAPPTADIIAKPNS